MAAIKMGRRWPKSYEMMHRVAEFDKAQEAGDTKECDKLRRWFNGEGYKLNDADERVRLEKN